MLDVLLLVVEIIAGLFSDRLRERVRAVVDRYFPPRDELSGTYLTSWSKGATRPQHEVLSVTIRGEELAATTLFTVDPETRYRMRGKCYRKFALVAEWLKPDSEVSGAMSAIRVDNAAGGAAFRGNWIGISSKSREPGEGRWYMERVDERTAPIPTLMLNEPRHKESLATLIREHENSHRTLEQPALRNVRVPTGKTLRLTVARGVFDPSLGRISSKLLNYADRFKPQRVLDLGAGCGYFSLYFAKFKKSHVIAIDVSDDAVTCASDNVAASGLSGSIELLHGDLYDPLYENHRSARFDLIIANLPFSKESLYERAAGVVELSKSMEPRYRHIFAATDDLLFRTIVGAGFYLAPEGHLLVVVGGSSNANVVKRAISVSGLAADVPSGETIRGESEEIRIVDLVKRREPIVAM